MTTSPDGTPQQAPQQPYGAPDPAVAKDIKNAKTYGILAIVFGAVSLLLGILALPSLLLGIYGFKTSSKLEKAGIVQNNSKTLNIVGLVIGIIAAILWILTMVLRIVAAGS